MNTKTTIKILYLVLISFLLNQVTQAQVNVTIGTATTTTATTSPSLVSDWFKNSKVMYRYKASEFQAQGITGPQSINSIAFNIFMAPTQPHPNYTIKIATATPTTNPLSTTFASNYTSAQTVVYSNVSQLFNVGWNTFNFTTPYMWNGTDDIIVDVCWDLQATYSNSGSVYYTASTGNMIYFWSDVNPACPYATGSSTYSNRANAIFNMQVPYPPCVGQPTTGSVYSVPANPCVGKQFTLKLAGNTLATAIDYTWQSATPTNPTNFTTLPGMPITTMNYTSTFVGPRWFRVISTCTTSNLSDTSAAVFVDSGSYYLCYCDPGYTSPNGLGYFIDSVGISNTTLKNGSTGKSLSGLQSFVNGTPNQTALLSQNSQYNITIKRGFSSAVDLKVGVWLDFDQNGNYDPAEFTLLTSGFGVASTVTAPISIPNNLPNGQIGMRVVMTRTALTGSAACLTTLTDGETEDYLVKVDYPPCTNPPAAGIASRSDSAICAGETFTLTDIGWSQYFTGISSIWERSQDGINFYPIFGASNDTLLTSTSTPTWYRFKVQCGNGAPSYSNVVKVDLFPSWACYCPNKATNTVGDYSDIGAVKFGNFLLYAPGGSHLLNPLANKLYTSQLNYGPIVGMINQTYNLAVYHIKKNETHTDAKVTVFIDYNRDGVYQAATEKVFVGLSTLQSYYLSTNLTIPSTATPGITGFRVVLNEDLGSNTPSDAGCGYYANGETEDYIIQILEDVTSVKNPSGINQFSTYPVPATNIVNYYFAVQKSGSYTLQVQNVNGQVIETKNMNVSTDYLGRINTSNYSAGIYFIKIINSETGLSNSTKFIIQ